MAINIKECLEDGLVRVSIPVEEGKV